MSADLITTGAILAVANKLLGKTVETISGDFAKLYVRGRDKLLEAATRKVGNINDGKRTNLRVTRDVLWNGSYSDESICAEYFGGILASSRSEDGKDDRGIFYTDIIKSLSSQQLMLHYLTYLACNRLWLAMPQEKKRPNIGLAQEISSYSVWFSTYELQVLGISGEKDLFALENRGLVTEFEANNFKLSNGSLLNYTRVSPTTLGAQLYSVAHNRLSNWREIPSIDFGAFPDISIPQHFTFSKEDLLLQLGLQEDAQHS